MSHTQPSHRVPAWRCIKSRSATARISPIHHIRQDLRIGIQHRVNKPHRLLAHRQKLIIDQGDDTAQRRGTGTRSIDKPELPVDPNHIVRSVGADIRECTCKSGSVVQIWTVGRREVGQVRVDGLLLVRRNLKDVGEATAAEDDSLAGGLGLRATCNGRGHIHARGHLGCAHGGDVGAASREAGREDSRAAVVERSVGFETLRPVASDACGIRC